MTVTENTYREKINKYQNINLKKKKKKKKICACGYQEVSDVSFSKNFEYVLNRWFFFKKHMQCFTLIACGRLNFTWELFPYSMIARALYKKLSLEKTNIYCEKFDGFQWLESLKQSPYDFPCAPWFFIYLFFWGIRHFLEVLRKIDILKT